MGNWTTSFWYHRKVWKEAGGNGQNFLSRGRKWIKNGPLHTYLRKLANSNLSYCSFIKFLSLDNSQFVKVNCLIAVIYNYNQLVRLQKSTVCDKMKSATDCTLCKYNHFKLFLRVNKITRMPNTCLERQQRLCPCSSFTQACPVYSTILYTALLPSWFKSIRVLTRPYLIHSAQNIILITCAWKVTGEKCQQGLIVAVTQDKFPHTQSKWLTCAMLFSSVGNTTKPWDNQSLTHNQNGS